VITEQRTALEGVFDLDLDVDGGGTPPDDQGGASVVNRGRHGRCPTSDCGGLLDRLGVRGFGSGERNLRITPAAIPPPRFPLAA
jgi:hypothetical protein